MEQPVMVGSNRCRTYFGRANLQFKWLPSWLPGKQGTSAEVGASVILKLYLCDPVSTNKASSTKSSVTSATSIITFRVHVQTPGTWEALNM